jgi:hypothetical protein
MMLDANHPVPWNVLQMLGRTEVVGDGSQSQNLALTKVGTIFRILRSSQDKLPLCLLNLKA